MMRGFLLLEDLLEIALEVDLAEGWVWVGCAFRFEGASCGGGIGDTVYS